MAKLRLDWSKESPVTDVDPNRVGNPAKTVKAMGVNGPENLAKAVVNSNNAKVGLSLGTYAAQASCPDGVNSSYRCPLYGDGCYAEEGQVNNVTHKLNQTSGLSGHKPGSADASPLDVAKDEAAALELIQPLWKKKRVNNWVRLHVVGDAVTAECAKVISAAAELCVEGGHGDAKNVWNYTHAWRQVPRSAWSSRISVLASCDTIDDLPKAASKGYPLAMVMSRENMEALGKQQNKEFGKVLKLDNGFSLLPCQYEIAKMVPGAIGKQCIECKWCMREDWLKQHKLVITFAAHTARAEKVAKGLVQIDTGAEMTTKNPAARRTTRTGPYAKALSRVPAREYSQPPYNETRPTSRDAYNAGLEAGAEDRHVPATKDEMVERVQSQAWQFLQGHRFSGDEGRKLATQFGTGYREGVSGKYTATANPGGVRDLLARWESKGGKYWVEVYSDERGQTYHSDDGGGNLGNIGEDAAIEQVEKRVLRGDFLPDRAKTPMVMTYHKGSPVKYSGHAFDTTAKRLNPHSGRLTLSGRNNDTVTRWVLWDGEEVGEVAPVFPPMPGYGKKQKGEILWKARDMQGGDHGRWYISDWAAAEALINGLGLRLRNPAGDTEASSAAAAMYASFHGRESGETLRYHEEEQYEDSLAVLGEMVELKVATLTKKDVVIDFTGCKTVLACNESGDQLYLVGGDQSIDLAALGFTGDKAKKTTVALGTAYELTYRTEKGFDKFKLTDYYHEIGEETGFQPIAIYNTLNQSLEIAGGEYKIKPEGIVN